MPYSDPNAVAAIARAIAAEQTCVYACGLAAAILKGAGKRRAVNQIADHRQRIQIASAMLDPTDVPATPPAFDPPSPVDDAKTARDALAALDNALVGRYAEVASVTEGEDRRWAITAAQSSASSAIRWGATSQAFPT